MPYVTVGKENSGNIDLYYKDWGQGPPVVFSHGWPLTADAFEDEMSFRAGRGFRCIAHDRRGHGRSSQPWTGNATCADVCPIGINTGVLIKHFRKMQHSVHAEELALDVARKWAEVEKMARLDVTAADVVATVTSPRLLGALTDAARSIVSKDLVPGVAGPMPHAAPANLPETRREGAAAVYFPACVNRIFGRDNTKPALPALYESFIYALEEATRLSR
jgi:hypothetical protein